MNDVQYDVEIDNRTRRIAIARAGGVFNVALDGEAYVVDAVRVDAHILSLIVSSSLGSTARRAYEITVSRDAVTSQLAIRVGARRVLVGLNGRRRARKEDGARAAAGPQRVAAPMPGKIVRVLVRRGDAVHARQPLVVVEAMKMENELRAARDGTVAEIHVGEGQSVDAGALLVVVQ